MIATSDFAGTPPSVTPLAISHPPLPWRQRVRTKLFFLVVLTLVPISGVSLFHTVHDYRRRIDAELQANLELADSVGLAFRNYAEGIWHTAEILAAILYGHGTPMAPEYAREILAAQAMAHPTIDAFAWYDADGRLIAASTPRFESVATRLTRQVAPFAGHDRVVANVPIDPAPGAAASGSAAVSGAARVSPERSLLVLATAIRDAKGALRGFIAAAMNPDNLGLVLPVERRRGRTIALADQSNFLVYVTPPEGVPDAARQVSLEQQLLSLTQEGVHTFLDYKAPWDGVNRVGAITPIPGVGWSVIAAAPRNDIVRPLLSDLVRGMVVFAAIAAASFGAATLIARDLSARLGKLWEAASSWARANFDVRAHVAGDDELARTAVTLNDMAERLQRLEKEREQFLHAAAHEMANPVTSILSAVQLLRHQMRTGRSPLETGALDRKLASIERDAGVLASLIPETVRLYTQEHNWSLRLQPVDLVSLLVELVDDVRSRSDHVITLDTGGKKEVWITGDPQRIRQVLGNLVDNAVKYSPAGEEIDIQLRRRDGKVTISVRDRGIGIPPGEEELIFQSFHRGANAEAIPGSGLGLFISRQIMNAHGGRIWARNNPDRGATFYIQFPG